MGTNKSYTTTHVYSRPGTYVAQVIVTYENRQNPAATTFLFRWVREEFIDVRAPAGPAFTVEIDPPSATMFIGSTVQLRCTVRDRAGNTVANPGLTWTTSEPGVATVNQNGVVGALGNGAADITCRLATGESATARIIVPAPTPQEILGVYQLSGTKTADSCPAGTFAPTISNPGPISIDATTTGDQTTIVIRSTANITGTYDPANGNYTGTGQVTSGSTILRESVEGQWRRGPVRLTGSLTFALLQASGALVCQATYNATYTKRP